MRWRSRGSSVVDPRSLGQSHSAQPRVCSRIVMAAGRQTSRCVIKSAAKPIKIRARAHHASRLCVATRRFHTAPANGGYRASKLGRRQSAYWVGSASSARTRAVIGQVEVVMAEWRRRRCQLYLRYRSLPPLRARRPNDSNVAETVSSAPGHHRQQTLHCRHWRRNAGRH